MRKLLTLSLIAIAASGCTTINKQALSPTAASDLKNQTIVKTSRTAPNFAAMTAGKAAFAILGAAAMISEGNQLVASNKVEDPADSIATQLATALSDAHGLRIVTSPVPVSSDDADQVAQASAAVARFAIDVQTLNWSFAYFPTDWSHYRVIYTAKARLIDSQSKAVISEGFCKRIPESNTNAPTYDALLANQAALLKSELSSAAEECVRSLKSEMLSL